MARNKSYFYLTIILTLLFVISGCNVISSSRESSSLTPVPIQTPNGAITFLNVGEEVRERILSDPASALAWEQKQNMYPVGGHRSTWLNQFTLSNSEESTKPSGLYHLSAQQPVYGRLLISNIFHTPHSLGLIFLLDYQPLQIQTESGVQSAYYLPQMPVGAEAAVEFLFPPFPQGLHHLSIVLITDPESTSIDPEYRWNQQRSFSEQRFDLWVDLDAIPVDTPTFVNREQAIAAGAFRAQFEVIDLSLAK